MSPELQARFDEVLDGFGTTEAEVAKLRALVEDIESEAFDRGQVSGTSPFDGSWPE